MNSLRRRLEIQQGVQCVSTTHLCHSLSNIFPNLFFFHALFIGCHIQIISIRIGGIAVKKMTYKSFIIQAFKKTTNKNVNKVSLRWSCIPLSLFCTILPSAQTNVVLKKMWHSFPRFTCEKHEHADIFEVIFN